MSRPGVGGSTAPAPSTRPLAALLAALLALSLLAGCASSSGDDFGRTLGTGDYLSAARILEEESASADDEDALFRSGLLRAIPESPLYDPEEAVRRMQLLLELHPDTEYRVEALQIVDMSEEMLRLRRALEELRAEMDARIARLQQRLDVIEGSLEGRHAEIELLRHEVAQLRAELGRSEGRIQELRRQLERLKAIDFDPAPN